MVDIGGEMAGKMAINGKKMLGKMVTKRWTGKKFPKLKKIPKILGGKIENLGKNQRQNGMKNGRKRKKWWKNC